MWLQEDFEYVEVYLCDAEDDSNTNVDTNTKILWKTREELKADLEKYYSSMDTVYQQALMILLTHLKNQTFIGKV